MTETANSIPDWAWALPDPEQYAGQALPDPSQFDGGLQFLTPKELAKWLKEHLAPAEDE